jgi:hypothetical protein
MDVRCIQFVLSYFVVSTRAYSTKKILHHLSKGGIET